MPIMSDSISIICILIAHNIILQLIYLSSQDEIETTARQNRSLQPEQRPS